MIERYTRPEMGTIWSDQHKLDTWVAIEIAVCEGWARRGRIPADAMTAIRSASCDVDRMREIERETDHDVIAFLRATGETVGEAARFIHLGLTSSDIVDTGLAMQTREAAELIGRGLDTLIGETAELAIRHRDTPMVGRTHGIHAEPTTFGLKVAVWYDELRRHRRRLALASDDIATGKISGAVGTHAHVPVELEDEVCAELRLTAAPASTQVVQRDRHAAFIMALAGLGGTLEKITTEVRHLARTEVREVQEPFGEGNMGSSAMPHKRNPHASERGAGLARLLRGYAVTAMENVALWHERDISHSSAERVIFPDACIIVDYLLDLVREILEDLVVFPEQMRANLDLTGGLIYSQRVLLALVDAGLDRQIAYKIVQRHALASWDGGTPFRDALEADERVAAVLTGADLDALFDPWDQLANVGRIFERLGLASEPSQVGAEPAQVVVR